MVAVVVAWPALRPSAGLSSQPCSCVPRLCISLFSLHCVRVCARDCVGAYRQVRGVHVVQCVRAYDSFNVNRRWHGLMRPLYFLRSNFYHPCERYKPLEPFGAFGGGCLSSGLTAGVRLSARAFGICRLPKFEVTPGLRSLRRRLSQLRPWWGRWTAR